MKSLKKSYRLYILIRNDLPSMNAGRAMAQAAHAANQFIHTHGKNGKVKDWQNEARGFGTTICLSANKETITQVLRKSMSKGYFAQSVLDPTYKFVVPAELYSCIDDEMLTAESHQKEDGQWICYRNELTCGYVFLPENDPDTITLVGDLPLHP